MNKNDDLEYLRPAKNRIFLLPLSIGNQIGKNVGEKFLENGEFCGLFISPRQNLCATWAK